MNSRVFLFSPVHVWQQLPQDLIHIPFFHEIEKCGMEGLILLSVFN
jgi:hypothetical protein